MLISVENARTMKFTHTILLLFFCVTNTWAYSQVDLESNDLNEGDHEGKLFNNNDVYSSLFKNNLRDGERVHVQLYYESLGVHSLNFYVYFFMPGIKFLFPYLDIRIYPFGNSKIIYDNGNVNFECQHGPDECYGNKLHACALDNLDQIVALKFNDCLMSQWSPGSFGSDDETADRCGSIMNMNADTIKDCAKGAKGTELLQYYGELSKEANFSYVPHLLINGKKTDSRGPTVKKDICAAFTHPPADC